MPVGVQKKYGGTMGRDGFSLDYYKERTALAVFLLSREYPFPNFSDLTLHRNLGGFWGWGHIAALSEAGEMVAGHGEFLGRWSLREGLALRDFFFRS